jgi:virginiamycin B lyase
MRSFRRWRVLLVAALTLFMLTGMPGYVPQPVARAVGPPPTPSLAATSYSNAAPQFVFIGFPLPHAGSQPNEIIVGPDGNLWFTEISGNRIGRITPVGTIVEFPLPASSGMPSGITAGPDGNIWFTEVGYFYFGKIARITPAGVITEFPLPNPEGAPSGITAGPDGNLWFTESYPSRIGRITPAGVITEFPLPQPKSQPVSITAGSDGNLWFTESWTDRIGRMTPGGVLTEFPLPQPNSQPVDITAGPDGHLWFTESNPSRIGRISPEGIITEFPLPTPDSGPYSITTGPDSNLWFTEGTNNWIGRITPSGEITEVPWSLSGSASGDLTFGPDGNLWFTASWDNQIVRMSGFAPLPTATPPRCTIQFRDVPVESWAYGYIRYLVCQHLASGYSDGTFRPDSAITRAQLTKLTVLAVGLPLTLPAGAPHFSDVPPVHPFYHYIEAARAAGLISGYSDGTFHPNAPVSRAQLAKILVGARNLPVLHPSRPAFGDVLPSHWAYSYIETVYAHGIVGGYMCGAAGEPCPGSYFRPGADATRAQLSTMFYQAFAVPARK